MRSSPTAVPAQKKELSGVTSGRNDVVVATMSSGVRRCGNHVVGPAGCVWPEGLMGLARLVRDSARSAAGPAGSAGGAAGSVVGAAGLAGRNLRMRKSMMATGSPAENQVLRVVTNQPSPRAVRLGPVTSRRRDRKSVV